MTMYGTPITILAQSGDLVIYTTGKHNFIGRLSGGVVRPMWTNVKMIPDDLKAKWEELDTK
jgi:hypothetical protein